MYYSKNDDIHFSKFTSNDEIEESSIYTKEIQNFGRSEKKVNMMIIVIVIIIIVTIIIIIVILFLKNKRQKKLDNAVNSETNDEYSLDKEDLMFGL